MFFLYLNKTHNIHIRAYISLFLVFSLLFSSAPLLARAQEQSADSVETQDVGTGGGQEDDSGATGEDSGDASGDEVVETVPEPDPENTIVETGDVSASANVVQETNTTETDTTIPETQEDEEVSDGDEVDAEDLSADGQDASQEEGQSLPQGDVPQAQEVQQEAVVENSSEAELVVEADATAESGDNEANDNDNSLVVTGDTIAEANVVTMANTNIVNSNGFIMLLGSLADYLDLRDLEYWNLLGVDNSTNPCDTSVCGTSYTLVENNSTASIENNVVVEASTGDNTATNNTGEGVVVTGNAYASANVVNIANTNIVNSNYLVFSVNHFGDVGGDLVLPANEDLAAFFSGGAQSSPAVVETNNEASIENNVSADADSGNNVAQGSDGSVVVTGDASASATVVNQVNQNYVNQDQFLFVFRVHGTWNGSVLGLPESFVYNGGMGGGVISSENSGGGTGVDGDTTYGINTTNTATIVNNVDVSASTGGNTATGNESSGIATGDAYAGANVVNVVNSNVLGRNWVLAIVNIFGNWSGSVSFGQADLWIAGQVDTHGKEYPEVQDEVRYHYTVVNNSDTIAPGVRVIDEHDEYLEFVSSVTGYQDGSDVVWDLGDLGPGESAEISYTARVKGGLPTGHTILESMATVSADISDANYVDNTEFIHITAFEQPHVFYSGPIGEGHVDSGVGLSDDEEDEDEQEAGSSGAGYALTDMPDFVLTKTNNANGVIGASTTVTYEITVKNNGGEAYYAVLYDVIKDKDGGILHEDYWPLDTVYPDEEIVIKYDVFYSGDVSSGTYTNYAHIEAIGRYQSLTSPLAEALTSPQILSAVVVQRESEDTGVGAAIIPTQQQTIERTSPNWSPVVNITGNEGSRVPTNSQDHLRSALGGTELFDQHIGSFLLDSSSALRSLLEDGGIGENNVPFGQSASVFGSLSDMWISRYSWILFLLLLGLGSVVLVRRRDYA